MVANAFNNGFDDLNVDFVILIKLDNLGEVSQVVAISDKFFHHIGSECVTSDAYDLETLGKKAKVLGQGLSLVLEPLSRFDYMVDLHLHYPVDIL